VAEHADAPIQPIEAAAIVDPGSTIGHDGRVDEPEPPACDALPPELRSDLDDRLRELSGERIRAMADYYALRSVESAHIDRLARRFGLSAVERDLVGRWWQRRVRDELGRRTGAIMRRQDQAHLRRILTTRFRRPNRGVPSHLPRVVHTAMRQIAFNTLGPGGRTWIDNRHICVRRYTIRLYWRP
jgi:hypothetical protein